MVEDHGFYVRGDLTFLFDRSIVFCLRVSAVWNVVGVCGRCYRSPDFSFQSRSAGTESDPEVPFVRMRVVMCCACAPALPDLWAGRWPTKVTREIGGRFVESRDHHNVYFSLLVVMFVST